KGKEGGNPNWIWWVVGLVSVAGGAGVVWKLATSINWKRLPVTAPNWLSQTSPYAKSAATNQPQAPQQTAPSRTIEPAKRQTPEHGRASAAKVKPLAQASPVKPAAARNDPAPVKPPAARRDVPPAPPAPIPPPSPPKHPEEKTA